MPLFQKARDRRGGYVLLVDDEPSIRDTISRFLEHAGYQVRTASSAQEGSAIIDADLRAAILDVILVNSGGRSGLDVLADIRALPNGAQVPVLMLTGYALNPEVLTAMSDQGADVLQKPVRLSVVLEWVWAHWPGQKRERQ